LHRRLRSCAAFLSILFLSGCRQAETSPSPAELHLAASSPAAAQIAGWLSAAYRQVKPRAIDETIRMLPETELWDALDKGEVQAIVHLDGPSSESGWTVSLGWTALTFAVPSSNSVRDLARNQVRDIYQGRITDWSDLGGTTAAIVRYAFADDSELGRLFSTGVLDGGQPAPDVFPTPGAWAMRQALAEDPNSMGCLLCSDIDRRTMRALTVDGVPPDYAHAGDGSYAFGIRVMLSTRADPTEAVEEFAGWAQSASGQEILRSRCDSGE
jgi:hypothetical protein